MKIFLALIALILLTGFQAGAFDKPDELLEKAWSEYGYQNWEKSKELFLDILSEKKAAAEQRLEARIGMVFLLQFRMPGRQPQKAIEAYKCLLTELPEDNEHAAMLMMNLGYCYITKENMEFDKAHEYFDKAIEAAGKNDNNLIIQQTVLRYLASYMTRPDRKKIKEGLEKSASLLPLVEGSIYAGPAHRMVADMAFCMGDFTRYEKELEAMYKSGIGNRSIRSKVVFTIARINDTRLKNYKKAEKYYRLHIREIPSGKRNYYCKLRADELEKGIIKSRIAGDQDDSMKKKE